MSVKPKSVALPADVGIEAAKPGCSKDEIVTGQMDVEVTLEGEGIFVRAEGDD